MSTALPVLWWNSTVIALPPGHPPVVQELALPAGPSELAAFVAALTPRPKSIRLFLTAAQLDASSATIPKNTAKAALKPILVSRYKALQEPTTRWGLLPIDPDDTSGTTLVFIEREPLLQAVDDALAELEVTLHSAFPLAALIDSAAAPNEPHLAICRAKSGSLIYWRNSAGSRGLTTFPSEQSDRFIADIVTAAEITGPTAKFLLYQQPDIAPFPPSILPRPASTTATLPDLLANTTNIPAASLANLLPPRSPFTPQRILYAGAAACLVVALCLSVLYLRDRRAAADNKADLALREQHKTAEVDRLRETKVRCLELQAFLDEAKGPPPYKASFIEALGHTRPSWITVRAITLSDRSITVRFVAHEYPDKTAFSSFFTTLGNAGPWTIASTPQPPINNEATFIGSFK